MTARYRDLVEEMLALIGQARRPTTAVQAWAKRARAAIDEEDGPPGEPFNTAALQRFREEVFRMSRQTRSREP